MTILKRSQTVIFGLPENLATIRNNIGDLTTLPTEDKTSLAAAIAEVFGVASAAPTDVLTPANNLSDVEDAALSRGNLGVLSEEEVQALVDAAQLGLGYNYTVADITERDAKEGLTTNDRVNVQDDGDGKWAIYRPSVVDEETGLVTEWQKLNDQDSLENALNAQGIKQAYESNDDTNAFDDASKAKVDLITVSEAVNLDDVLLTDDLTTSIEGPVDDSQVPTALAVQSYVQSQTAAAGQKTVLENVTVAGDTIALTYEPTDGTASILNFATVRYIDADGVAYDAPVASTANAGEFTVGVDTAGQWDGFTIQVQYQHKGVETVPSDTMGGGGTGDGSGDDGTIDQGELPEPT